MLLILLVEMVFLAVVWLGVLWVHDVPLQGVFAKALVLIFAELTIVSAVAMFFSSFSTPILSGVLTLAFWLSGRVVYLIEEMLHSTAKAGLFNKAPALRPFGEALTRIFPDLKVFNVTEQILLGKEVTNLYVIQSYAYAGSYVAVMIVAAVLFFRRRDFV